MDGRVIRTVVWCLIFVTHKQRTTFSLPYNDCSRFYFLWQPSIAVRPNPVLFALPEQDESTGDSSSPAATAIGAANSPEAKENQQQQQQLPYRSIFAVLTWDSVLVYDTVHDRPLAVAKGLHYANIVDATWTPDGHTLLVCSTDGYISILRFAPGELGTVYRHDERSAVPSSSSQAEANKHPNNVGGNNDNVSKLAAGAGAAAAAAASCSSLLPPCEPGPAAVECPPAKRAKTRIVPEQIGGGAAEPPQHSSSKREQDCLNVDKLSLDGGGSDGVPNNNDSSSNPVKKKKRIQPTLLSTT